MATVASAKQKGRKLQQMVRDLILKLHPSLHADDVRSTAMGQSGEDVQLSPAARKLFPYSIECKARKSLAISDWYSQCKTNAPKGMEPLLVVKQDRCKPLVVVDADHYFELLERLNG